MDLLRIVFDYVHDHPAYVIAAGIFFGLYFLLDRKTALTRQGDLHLGELRKQRGDYYNKLRRPE